MTTSNPTGDETHPISYSIYLPDGFIELPGGEPDEQKVQQLASALANRFGLSADGEIDEGLASSTVLLMTIGAAAAAGGADYTAAGIFRSHEDPERPVMTVVSCLMVPSDHDSPRTAIAGLQQHHRDARSDVVQLPAGEAVVVQAEEAETLTADDQTFEVTKHSITAWIPDPTGAGLLAVAVTSNNTDDWKAIVDMAGGVFETIEWTSSQEAVQPTASADV